MIDIRLDGLSATLARLQEIPRRLASAGVRKAIRAGARPIIQAARAGAPVQLGHLRRSINVKYKTYRHSGVSLAVIGPLNRKFKDGANPAKYAHLVELGTKAHIIKGPVTLQTGAGPRVVQNIRHPGARAQPFLATAAAQTKAAALQAFAAKLTEEIMKA